MELLHGTAPKMAIFHTFFQAIQHRKMSFTIFQNEKTPFQAIKKTGSKSLKIDIFPNGLSRGFGPKMGLFPTFFFGNIAQKNVRYDILEQKNAFLVCKKRTTKSRKIDIFPKGLTHGFGLKMAILGAFFQAIQGSKMSFTIFQNEKTPFQAIEIRGSKSRKIDIFHGFGLKMAIFQTFFLGNIGRENVFNDILERKYAFRGYKNKKLKMSKN